MEFLARAAMVLSLAIVGVAVHLVARAEHPRRIFMIHLDRATTDADRNLARWVILGNVAVCLIASTFILTSSNLAAIVVVMTVASLLSPAVLMVGYIKVIRSLDRPRVSGRYVVPLESCTIRDLIWPPLEIANVALIVACSLSFAWIHDHLPGRIPLQWGADGEVRRTGAPGEMWVMAGMMLFYVAITWMVAWSAARERMALAPDAPEEALKLQMARRQMLVRMIEIMMLGLNLSTGVAWIGVAVAAMPGRGGVIAPALIVSLVIALGAIVLPLMAYLKPMLEVRDRLKALSGSEVLGTRADAWVLGGTIYYAPEDPALFVPKPYGIGQTLNFGRPSAWVLLGTLILLPLGISVVGIIASR